MNTFDPKHIEELLTANKEAEAKIYLESFLKKGMTEQEKAAVHTDFITLHMRVMLEIQKKRNEALRGILSDLKIIDESQRKAGDAVKVAKLRESLS